jgi:hypothetical protein
MKQAMKKVALATICAGGLAASMQAQATNWIMLQGTEPESAMGRAKVWGFLQPTYQKDYSDKNGPLPEPTRIGPNLDNQEQMQLFRARIGVRGTGMPIDPKVNYFIMIEGGSNGATNGGSLNGKRTPVRLMDASVTLNEIKGARIRTGLFKTPGPEEILQGIITFDYINLTDVSNQMMMERFPAGVKATCTTYTDSNGDTVTPTNDCASGNGPLFANEASWGSSFGAARDIGVQVFDSFKAGGWDTTYAIMVGNGNGLETGGIANGMDKYVYLSTEKSFPGGWGPKPNGLKMFVWAQKGQRKVDLTDNATADPVNYDRKRQGLGFTYRNHGIRAIAEYMTGEGMIFQGPEKPNMGIGATDANFGGGGLSTMDLKGKANGYYVDLGYEFPRTNWELDLRYDVYHRSTDNKYIDADFKRLTYGVQYHFNRKTKFLINYEVRNDQLNSSIIAATSPATTPVHNMQTNIYNALNNVGNRLGVQVTHIF